MSINPDTVSRTAKIFTDSGEADSVVAAHAMLDSFVVQVHIGRGMTRNRCRQAAALTVVNAAARAFKGGVHVQILEDAVLDVGWHNGETLGSAIERHGGVVVDSLDFDHPTICIGEPVPNVPGRPTLRATFDGWTAGVVEGATQALAERDLFVPAGVAAAGIAVAEAFEFRRGKNLIMGRRSQGISLWRPDVVWTSPDAVGPEQLGFAPGNWWLAGLGHLGQGYLWTIGMFPYATRQTSTS